MTETPRIPPLAPEEWTDEIRTVLGPLLKRNPVDNVFATFVQHPDLFRRYKPIGNHVLGKSDLAARERELAILRIGSLNHARYEFAQHTAVGMAAGLTEAEVARVHAGPAADGWNDLDRAILTAVDELFHGGRVGDETWSDLSRHYDTRQMMDLVFAIGVYNLISWSLNSWGVQLDDHLGDHPWPPSAHGGRAAES